MWCHLLIASAFVALGSCREFERAEKNVSICPNPGQSCTCSCNLQSCPPCPIPVPAPCLDACGSSLCPCPSPREQKRANLKPKLRPDPSDTVTSISTVNVKPSGPVCSAFHILPHLAVTSSSCIAGKSARELFVMVSEVSGLFSPKREPLKVEKIEIYPYSTVYSEPILLVLQRPKLRIDFLALPPIPVDTSLTGEMQKWQITNSGKDYSRVSSEVESFAQCNDPLGRDQICVKAKNVTRMGWNDIGTPFVVRNSDTLVVHGIYMGKGLYTPDKKIEYLSMYPYGPWLYKMIEQYE